jgi:hypothetical protein
LALKGSAAALELAEDRAVLRQQGAVEEVVETYGDGSLDEQTTVVRVVIGNTPMRRRATTKSRVKSNARTKPPG